ncbi:hypothetical protein [Oceanomicrobium pacificus]|uniref:Uncharacterized protein n=1 Tax=Oceanomicrobium pacificus TaxID=2692916 RepID=A0A6B0TJA4_9RHOB|nr:hypothetical protein [Oceanomicrobium pacificus]MXU64500.1 hypothetical protein [Oceanomicrobium pacificus]
MSRLIDFLGALLARLVGLAALVPLLGALALTFLSSEQVALPDSPLAIGFGIALMITAAIFLSPRATRRILAKRGEISSDLVFGFALLLWLALVFVFALLALKALQPLAPLPLAGSDILMGLGGLWLLAALFFVLPGFYARRLAGPATAPAAKKADTAPQATVDTSHPSTDGAASAATAAEPDPSLTEIPEGFEDLSAPVTVDPTVPRADGEPSYLVQTEDRNVKRYGSTAVDSWVSQQHQISAEKARKPKVRKGGSRLSNLLLLPWFALVGVAIGHRYLGQYYPDPDHARFIAENRWYIAAGLGLYCGIAVLPRNANGITGPMQSPFVRLGVVFAVCFLVSAYLLRPMLVYGVPMAMSYVQPGEEKGIPVTVYDRVLGRRRGCSNVVIVDSVPPADPRRWRVCDLPQEEVAPLENGQRMRLFVTDETYGGRFVRLGQPLPDIPYSDDTTDRGRAGR